MGFKQKMKAEGFPFATSSSSTHTGQVTSKLARKLLERWCWGKMSLPTLRELAEAGVQDGIDDELLRSFGII